MQLSWIFQFSLFFHAFIRRAKQPVRELLHHPAMSPLLNSVLLLTQFQQMWIQSRYFLWRSAVGWRAATTVELASSEQDASCLLTLIFTTNFKLSDMDTKPISQRTEFCVESVISYWQSFQTFVSHLVHTVFTVYMIWVLRYCEKQTWQITDGFLPRTKTEVQTHGTSIVCSIQTDFLPHRHTHTHQFPVSMPVWCPVGPLTPTPHPQT